MRNALIKINNALHVLLALPIVTLLVIGLASGKSLNLLAGVVLIIAITLLVFGVGSYLRPAITQKIMVVFHLIWLVITLIWIIYFLYAISTNKASGFGGLFFIYSSAFILPITFLSILTLLIKLSPKLERKEGSGLEHKKGSGLITWKRVLTSSLAILIGVAALYGLSYQADKQAKLKLRKEKVHAHEAGRQLKKFLSAKRNEIFDKEVFMVGDTLTTAPDYWGTPYKIILKRPAPAGNQQYYAEVQGISAGADRLFETGDDIQLKITLTRLKLLFEDSYSLPISSSTSTTVLLKDEAAIQSFIHPHSSKFDITRHYELVHKDKWNRKIRLSFTGDLTDGFARVYSAGMDGVFGTGDDLQARRKLRRATKTDPTYQFNLYSTNAKTMEARRRTFDLVEKIATQNSTYEIISREYHPIDKPQLLDISDDWGQPLHLYHANRLRNIVSVYSVGEDGIKGNFDDLLFAAVDDNVTKQLALYEGNTIPTRDYKPASVFFEVYRPKTPDRVAYGIALAKGKISRQALIKEYPSFYFAGNGGQMCKANYSNFGTRPAKCCGATKSSLLIAEYVIESDCQVKISHKAFLIEPENLEFFDMAKKETLSGRRLSTLPMSYLYDSCNYHQLGLAEFYYCRPTITPKSRSLPFRSYLYVNKKLVYAHNDYVALGADGYGYYENTRKDFIASYQYKDKTYYMLRSGAVIFKDNDKWRMSKRTPLDYYGECDCP